MYKVILTTVAVLNFSSAVIAQERQILFSEDPLIFTEENPNEHVEVTGVFFNTEQNLCGVEINYVTGVTQSYQESNGDWFQKIKLSPDVTLTFLEGMDEFTLAQVSSAAAEKCWPNN